MFFCIFTATRRGRMLLKYELKKQLEKPFCFVALAVCALFNILLLFSDDYTEKQIMRENDVAKALGTVFVTEEKISQLDDKMQQATAISYLGGYIDPADAPLVIDNILDLTTFNCLALKNAEIVHSLSDERLSGRIEEVNENREMNAINGGIDLLMTLFVTQFTAFAFESALFAVLIGSKTAGHEFLERAEQIIYSTRTGRKIMLVKLSASLILSAGFCMAVSLLGTAAFLIKCPCFELLSAPWCVNSPLFFTISWFYCPLWLHIFLNMIILTALSALFAVLSFALFGFVKNTVLSVLGTVVILLAMYIPTPFITQEGCIKLIWLSMPSVQLLTRPGFWLSVNKASVPVFGYEEAAILLWGTVFLAVCAVSMKKFGRTYI